MYTPYHTSRIPSTTTSVCVASLPERVRFPGMVVLVAGGGIGGLTFAHACLRSGIPVVVLESAKALAPRGSGIGLWGPALTALRALNLEPTQGDVGRNMAYAGYRRGDGSWIATAKPQLDRFTSCLCLRRSDLHAALLGSLPSGVLRLNSKVVDHTEDTDGVTVVLENGQSVRGSLLVGADGIWSPIRQRLNGTGAWR